MLREILMIKQVDIPRKIWVAESGIRTLCLFWDGSVQAYAAVVYARMETKEGFFSRIVASKARVTPVAGMTIPRSELNALLHSDTDATHNQRDHLNDNNTTATQDSEKEEVETGESNTKDDVDKTDATPPADSKITEI